MERSTLVKGECDIYGLAFVEETFSVTIIIILFQGNDNRWCQTILFLHIIRFPEIEILIIKLFILAILCLFMSKKSAFKHTIKEMNNRWW
jgi:hypothetical protein